ncbi:MAG: RNA-directed DNA polymerase [Vampirovibrio sp.]
MVNIVPVFLDDEQADFFTNMDKIPPYFTSKFLFSFINNQKNLSRSLSKSLKDTKCLRFTTPNKKTSHRRELKVPNPYVYLQLAHKVSELYTKKKDKDEDNVPNLKTDKLLNLQFEKEKPILKKHDVISSRCYKDVQGYSYHLKIDISQFYPSIYTHSIPWAILGKEDAKKKYDDSSLRCDLYNLGNDIDKLLQNMNSKQTKGIPVGATLFHFVAKLITDRIDIEFSTFIETDKIDCEFSHYVDDYYVFCHSEADANRLLSEFGNILNRYELHINAQKTQIIHVDEWSVIPFWQTVIEEALHIFNDFKNDFLWSKLTEKRLLLCFEKIRKLRKGKYKSEHHLNYFLSALLSHLEKPLREYWRILYRLFRNQVRFKAFLQSNVLYTPIFIEPFRIFLKSSELLNRLHHFQTLLENLILPFVMQCISLEPSTIRYIAEQKTVKMLKPFLQNNEKSKKVIKATLQKTIDHYYTQELMWVLYVLIEYELLDIVSDEDVLYKSLKEYPNSMVKCLVMEIELDPSFCSFPHSLFEETKSDYEKFKDEDWKNLYKSEDWLLYFFIQGKQREQNEDFTLCETGIPLIDNFFKETTGNKTFFDKEAKVLKRSYYDPHFQNDGSLS